MLRKGVSLFFMAASSSVASRKQGQTPASVLTMLAVWLFGALPAAAQPETSRPSGPGFTESIDVQVVNIDVYVTGADGKPVLGLGPEDFELRVDGNPVGTSNFYAVELRDDELFVRRGGEVEARPLAPPPPADPREADRLRRAPPKIPAEQALHVAVYIDNFNLTPFNRNRVLRELRAFIREHLRPEDQVMLASSDPGLTLRMPFTNNREELNRALLELEEVSAQRIHRNNERRDLINNVNDVNNEESMEDRPGLAAAQRAGLTVGGGGSWARNELMAYAGSVRNDTNLAIDALTRVVENLSAAPGRKAMPGV